MNFPLPRNLVAPTLVERVPSDTARQGTATLTWVHGATAGTVGALVDVGKWTAPDPRSARPVRVTFFPLNAAPIGPFNPAGPSPGAMGLLTYTGQNGIEIKRWIACPADFTIAASSVRLQAVAVGLPYQALPQNCRPNASTFDATISVGATFAEGETPDFPSIPIYPTGFLATSGGAAMGAGNAKQPLITDAASAPTKGLGASGFLRALTVTNGSGATIYVVALDLQPNDHSASAPAYLQYSSFAPFAVPAATTVIRSFDDLPFLFGPYVAALTGFGSGFADGTSIYVEGSWVPITTPGF